MPPNPDYFRVFPEFFAIFNLSLFWRFFTNETEIQKMAIMATSNLEESRKNFKIKRSDWLSLKRFK